MAGTGTSCLLDYYTIVIGNYFFDPSTSFSFAGLAPQLITQFVLMKYGHLISERFKIQGIYLLMAIGFVCIPILGQVGTNEDHGLRYWVFFSLVLTLGTFNGVLVNSIFGLSATLPSKYVRAFILGQGICGLIMNTVKWVLLALFTNIYTITILYCLVSSLIMIFFGICYSILINNHYFNKCAQLNL